jgi:O-antigen ligase
MSSAIDLLVPLLLLVGAVFLSLRLSQFPVLAAALITTTPIMIIFVATTPGFQFGGLNIYYEDIVSLVLLSQAAYRIPTLKKWNGAHALYALFAIFTIMILVSVLRGAMAIPIKTVIVETRTWLFPVSTIYYFTSVKLTREQFDKVGTVIEWSCLILVLITVFRYGLLATGHVIQFSDADTEEVHRPVPSGTAMFMASSVLFIWYRIATGKASIAGKLCATILPLLVVALQHRSVWSAFIVMLLLAVFFGGEIRKRARIFVAFCAALLLALVVFAPDSGEAKSLQTSVATSHGSDSTIGWREQSWTALLQPSFVGAPINYVVGKPMGASFRRKLTLGKNSYWTEVSPHNNYVIQVLRIGLVGLSAFIGFMSLLLFRLWRMNTDESKILAFISLGVMFYWVAYVFDEPQGFYIALGLRLLIGFTPQELAAPVIASLARVRGTNLSAGAVE